MTDPREQTTRRPYEQDDAFRSSHVNDAAMGSDGTVFYQLIGTVGAPRGEDERQRSTIWRVDPATGEAGEVTAWAANATAPAVSGDGEALYFLAATDKAAPLQLYRLAIAAGTLTRLTDLAAGVTLFAVAPDGGQIALAATDPDVGKRRTKGHTRITARVYRYDPLPGYLQDKVQALHVMPADGAAAPVAISPYDGQLSAIAWSPDSRRLAYVVNGAAPARDWGLVGDLYVGDASGERRRLLESRYVVSPQWTADGGAIVFASPPNHDFSRQFQLYLVDAESGAETGRTTTLDRSVPAAFQIHNPAQGGGKILVDGDAALACVGYGGQGPIGRIALAGPERVERLHDGDAIDYPFALAGRRLVFARQHALHPPELWVRDLDEGTERQLSRHNAPWRAKVAWPRLEIVRVESAGVPVEGWVLTPPTGRAPHPALLYIHGGPHAAFGHGFFEDFHELVGRGYAVIFVNPRGSVHYGDAFSTATVGKWGHPELADFDALLDDLVARGTVDHERLGVLGFSGGGHLSAWLTAHSDRFRAAVPEQGIYNMLSAWGVSDAGSLIALEMGGKPHEQPERYWALSPVAHAHRTRTPTLLIQGENDVRCPMEQAEQLYAVLKDAGCEVEFLRLDACNHGAHIIKAPSIRRLRMDAVLDWFDRHLG